MEVVFQRAWPDFFTEGKGVNRDKRSEQGVLTQVIEVIEVGRGY